MAKTDYPQLDVIRTAVDPYFRLFTTVRRWQISEKKWMDGAFLDLNSEQVEAEVEEYFRELFKIKKTFTNLVKKKKLELANKVMEKRKARGKSIEVLFSVCLRWHKNSRERKYPFTMSLGKKRMEEEAAGGGSATEPEAAEKDDDERELEKLEKNDPEMLRICTIILDQLEKFKVRSFVEIAHSLIRFHINPCVRV